MDPVELTKLFVDRAETADRLAEIDRRIQAAVIEAGETVKMAGVTATYYQPSRKYDYEAAGKKARQEIIDANTKTTKSVSWKDVCEDAGIDEIPFEETPARVVIK